MATSTQTPTLRDYKHASQLFVADKFRLLPKSPYLFYVYFDISDGAKSGISTENNKREIGLLVKSVDLPKFTMETKTHNAYNRPNIIQTKIRYDGSSIVFHDDSANVIRDFLEDYFKYYYRDSDHGSDQSKGLYTQDHKYNAVRPTEQWGYTIRSASANPYLTSIRIYSLHRTKFSEYILINPVVKSFKHAQLAHSSIELLQHEMQVEFETVLYDSGSVSENSIPGYMDLHYDNTPSPLKIGGKGSLELDSSGVPLTPGQLPIDSSSRSITSPSFATPGYGYDINSPANPLGVGNYGILNSGPWSPVNVPIWSPESTTGPWSAQTPNWAAPNANTIPDPIFPDEAYVSLTANEQVVNTISGPAVLNYQDALRPDSNQGTTSNSNAINKVALQNAMMASSDASYQAANQLQETNEAVEKLNEKYAVTSQLPDSDNTTAIRQEIQTQITQQQQIATASEQEMIALAAAQEQYNNQLANLPPTAY